MPSVTLVHPAKGVGRTDGMTCHLAGTLVWTQVTLHRTAAPVSRGKGIFGRSKPKFAAAYCQTTLALVDRPLYSLVPPLSATANCTSIGNVPGERVITYVHPIFC